MSSPSPAKLREVIESYDGRNDRDIRIQVGAGAAAASSIADELAIGNTRHLALGRELEGATTGSLDEALSLALQLRASMASEGFEEQGRESRLAQVDALGRALQHATSTYEEGDPLREQALTSARARARAISMDFSTADLRSELTRVSGRAATEVADLFEWVAGIVHALTAIGFSPSRGYVFVSYSHSNATYVQQLIEFFGSEGLDVRFDESHLGRGERIDSKIASLIDGCSAFVLVASEQAKDSRWVGDEVAYALDTERPVVVLRLDSVKWLGVTNRRLEQIDGNGMPSEELISFIVDLTMPSEDDA